MSNGMVSLPRDKLEAMAFGRMGFDEFSQYMDELQGMLAKPAVSDDDQPASDHQFYTAQLQARAAKVLGLDPENTSWFEVVGEMEKAAQHQGDPVAYITVDNPSGRGNEYSLDWAIAAEDLPEGEHKLYTRPVEQPEQPASQTNGRKIGGSRASITALKPRSRPSSTLPITHVRSAASLDTTRNT